MADNEPLQFNKPARFHWWADGESGTIEAVDEQAAEAAVRYTFPDAEEVWIRPADEEQDR